MNILVAGSGGREHALCLGLKKSVETSKLYCAPGNPGINSIAECVEIKADDIDSMLRFAKEKNIDLVVFGPEKPLCDGAADVFRKNGIAVFGPSMNGAKLEGSKEFSKRFMKKYSIPTAEYGSFTNRDDAEKYIESEYASGRAVVVKADGLAAGKGVIVASSKDEALKAVSECFSGAFGASGTTVVIEEQLYGEEASILALTDGKTIIPLASSQDHKRLLDGDKGPNTGGMGAYSPAPVVTAEIMKEIDEKVLGNFLRGVREEKIDYRGIIYAGIMVTKEGIKVLEFNVRFGDPETEAIIPRLKSSLADALYKTAVGRTAQVRLEWDESPCVCIVLASGGYPGAPDKGRVIDGTDSAEKNGGIVFHAGTALENGRIVNSGGRVLVVAASGETIRKAAYNAYTAAGKISFRNMQMRKDIAKRAIDRGK